MPVTFDPTKPAANSPVSSGELRGQLNALKALIDDCVPAAQEAADLQGTALNPAGAAPLGLTVSDPPTQFELQEVADKSAFAKLRRDELDELIAALKRV